MALYVDNAISWAQWRIRGGLKHLLFVAGGYLLAALLFIVLPYQLAEQQRDKSNVLEVASMFILVIQLVMMLLLAGMATANALRRDLTSRLIESHRLMPMSPVQAIVGYIAGSAMPSLVFCVINIVLGAILCQIRGIPVRGWLVANGLLAGFSMAIWSAMAMTTFFSRAMMAGLIGMFFGITFSGGMIFILVPGLLAFCSPMHGPTIFDYATLDSVTTGTVVAVGAQMLVAILCIRGAARKYADANAIGLTLGPALAAMGLWGGLSWVGITDFHELRPHHLRDFAGIDWRVLVVGAMTSGLLAALLPMAALAWSAIQRREQMMDGQRPERKRWGFLFGLSACLLFVLLPLSATVDSRIYDRMEGWNNYAPPQLHVPSALPQPSAQAVDPPVPVLAKDRSKPAMIAAACGIFLVQAYFLMLLLYPRVKRANAVILFITVMLWFVPLLADVFYYGEKDKQTKLDVFALFSPIGSIVQGLDTPAKGTWMGIAGQAILCGAIGMLVLMARRRKAKGPPPLPVGLAGDL